MHNNQASRDQRPEELDDNHGHRDLVTLGETKDAEFVSFVYDGFNNYKPSSSSKDLLNTTEKLSGASVLATRSLIQRIHGRE